MPVGEVLGPEVLVVAAFIGPPIAAETTGSTERIAPRVDAPNIDGGFGLMPRHPLGGRMPGQRWLGRQPSTSSRAPSGAWSMAGA